MGNRLWNVLALILAIILVAMVCIAVSMKLDESSDIDSGLPDTTDASPEDTAPSVPDNTVEQGNAATTVPEEYFETVTTEPMETDQTTATDPQETGQTAGTEPADPIKTTPDGGLETPEDEF